MYVDTKARAEAPLPPELRSDRALRGRYNGTPAPRHVDESAWAAYLASPKARIERLDSHEILFHEDDRADHIYEVASGSVRAKPAYSISSRRAPVLMCQ